jgi:hypothetical protein
MAIRCITVHRRDACPARPLGGAAVILMPYEGKSVSILEMLEILTSSGRSEPQAGIELERAFEDRAIRLLVPLGVEVDVTLWPEISVEEKSGLIGLLRDLCNRKPITTIGTWNLPIDLFKSTRAIRSEFELVCGLRRADEDASPPLGRRFASDEQLVAEALEGIRSGRWANAHRAAVDLEKRAEGASPEAKIRRLGGKIRGAGN